MLQSAFSSESNYILSTFIYVRRIPLIVESPVYKYLKITESSLKALYIIVLLCCYNTKTLTISGFCILNSAPVFQTSLILSSIASTSLYSTDQNWLFRAYSFYLVLSFIIVIYRCILTNAGRRNEFSKVLHTCLEFHVVMVNDEGHSFRC